MKIYITYRETSIYRVPVDIDTGDAFVKRARDLQGWAKEIGGSPVVEAVDHVLLQVDDDPMKDLNHRALS